MTGGVQVYRHFIETKAVMPETLNSFSFHSVFMNLLIFVVCFVNNI